MLLAFTGNFLDIHFQYIFTNSFFRNNNNGIRVKNAIFYINLSLVQKWKINEQINLETTYSFQHHHAKVFRLIYDNYITYWFSLVATGFK